MSVVVLESPETRIRGPTFIEDGSSRECREEKSKKLGIFGWRHVQAIMLFLAWTVAFSTRISLSVAIVTMVSKDGSAGDYETFDWDSSAQSYVLSSFFWGYIVTQVPGGQLADRWNAKQLLFIGIGANGLVTLLNPLAASLGGWKLLCTCRVLMGLLQGCLMSATQTILSRWAPSEERARLGTFVVAGVQVGTVISMSITGLLSGSSAGWPSGFYVFGGTCVAWGVAWFFIGSNSPSQHRWISREELEYIESSLETMGEKKVPRTPWKAILSSNPVWALAIVNGGYAWGMYMLLTGMPTYLSGILGASITTTGSISALPYLAKWLLGFPMSYLADWIIERGYVKMGTSRKICNTIGCCGPAILLIVMSYIDQQVTSIAILVVAVALSVGGFCGYILNPLDLSLNFAGTIMGLMNIMGTIFAAGSPLAQGLIVTDSSNISQWRTLFIISAALFFLSNLYFVVFGSGEIQWWNEPPEDDASNDRKSTSTIPVVEQTPYEQKNV